MTRRLIKKTALVTAAGQGIGRATALAFSREGARVFAVDIDEDSLRDLRKEESKITVIGLDVTDDEAIEKLPGQTGVIDVLFNCAGYVHQGTILECDNDIFDLSVRMNVRSIYKFIQTYLPSMLANNGGSIVNVASVVSNIKAARDRFIYATTKAAVIGLTKSVAMDFIDRGIRSNAICPGTVHTPSLEQRIAEKGGSAEVLKEFVNRQPMGRLGTSQEVAALAVYLASDESAFTTGAAHIVDGGFSL